MSKVKDFSVKSSKILSEVKIFKPTVNLDIRGSLYTNYHADIFKNYIPNDINFKHDKFSKSNKNVLRGIHGDFSTWKLVTCLNGKIFQVVVDCNKESKTFLKYDSFIMENKNPFSVLIPPGYGNAFLVLSKDAVYHYKLAYKGDYLDYDQQFTFNWNNKRINVDWPIKNPILSNRDK
jgi:dTDP-4-dehydrorhamnose 3,5-epimerase